MTPGAGKHALLIVDGIDPPDALGATADAHMRDFDMEAPFDCCGSITAQRNAQARALPRQSLNVQTRGSRRL